MFLKSDNDKNVNVFLLKWHKIDYRGTNITNTTTTTNKKLITTFFMLLVCSAASESVQVKDQRQTL